jgi:hypothetical protein
MNTAGWSLRRVGVLLSGVAIVAAIVAGCGSAATEDRPQGGPGPLTTTNPNSYAPTVIAPGAPTALPGNVNTG